MRFSSTTAIPYHKVGQRTTVRFRRVQGVLQAERHHPPKSNRQVGTGERGGGEAESFAVETSANRSS